MQPDQSLNNEEAFKKLKEEIEKTGIPIINKKNKIKFISQKQINAIRRK